MYRVIWSSGTLDVLVDSVKIPAASIPVRMKMTITMSKQTESTPEDDVG